MKQCSRCWAFKPKSEFYTRTDGRHYGNLSSRCKNCVKEEANEHNRKFPERQVVSNAKHRAKKAWLPFDLDAYRSEIRHRLTQPCELTGTPFKIGGERDWNSPSIDRIDPEKGYVYSNIRIILWALNSAFGYWGEDQFEVVARAWLERKDR